MSIGHQVKRKKSALYIASAVYLSLFAVERIDLLQGNGSFGFTLELLGCILFLMSYLIDILTQKGRFLFSKQLISYSRIICAFMTTVLLSVPFSADVEMSARRVLLLTIYVFSGMFSVNYLVTCKPENARALIVKSMVFLSVVYALFSLYDAVMWFNAGLISRISRLLPFFRSNVWSIGSDFVRVRGASGDPNRAGIFMIIASYIILRYCERPALKVVVCIVNAAVLILTLSRTAFLCLALFVVLHIRITKRKRKNDIIRTIIYFFLVLGIIISLYQVPMIKEAVDHMLLKRLKSQDASAKGHVELIISGLKAAFTDIKILLLGNGYGVSSNLTGFVSKYSNFHNAYVSFLAECGIFSALLFIAMQGYVLLKDKKQLPIIAVLVLANIPYQIYIEPYYWFLLPLLCVSQQLPPVGGKNKES